MRASHQPWGLYPPKHCQRNADIWLVQHTASCRRPAAPLRLQHVDCTHPYSWLCRWCRLRRFSRSCMKSAPSGSCLMTSCIVGDFWPPKTRGAGNLSNALSLALYLFFSCFLSSVISYVTRRHRAPCQIAVPPSSN